MRTRPHLGLCLLLPIFFVASVFAQQPLRIAVVGLNHGHIDGLLGSLPKHPEVQLVGLSEPRADLRNGIEQRFKLAHTLFFADERVMLAATHPAAVVVYTSPAGHVDAIKIAAPIHVAVMVEKPLATTVADAVEIAHLAAANHIPVLTNYETTWYRSNTAAIDLQRSGKIGPVRRVVVHDGHKGPKEIGVRPEFLDFLSDPKQNGGGALFDFGCYGADLMTVLMHGELPLRVTAVTHTDKPEIYPHTDDESTILLQYPQAIADLQGSWNWPFDRKDMEIYGATGYVQTLYTSAAPGLQWKTRLPGQSSEQVADAPELASPHDDSLHYLAAVVQGRLDPGEDMSSLPTNVKVVRILDAARRSAAEGRTVQLDMTQ